MRSTRTRPSPPSMSRDFFDTTAPRVRKYVSSNSPVTKRRIREVFPTPSSPTRHAFLFTTDDVNGRGCESFPEVLIDAASGALVPQAARWKLYGALSNEAARVWKPETRALPKTGRAQVLARVNELALR